MKTIRNVILVPALAVGIMQITIQNVQAQTRVLVHSFDTIDEVLDTEGGGGDAWQNWFGTAYYQVLWDASDAGNDVSSGSLKIEAFYPDSGIGGCCGAQFFAINGFNGFTNETYPFGISGNGNAYEVAVATNLEFDIRFDPSSAYYTNSGNWPGIEVGTRGTNNTSAPSQYYFNNYPGFQVSAVNTNWVHASIPIGPNANWTNIPNIFFKHWSGTWNDINNPVYVALYIDNIAFTLNTLSNPPPTMVIEEAKPGLRIFAGSTENTYDRAHLTSVDTNQSWVGGTYPVSYSFNLRSFPEAPTNQPAVFRHHIFLIPLDYAGGNSLVDNQYLEFQAGNNLWLNVQTLSTLSPGLVEAQIAWKTNLPNANPNQVALTITNSTALGTWALTFNSPSNGTLTAPGASPVAFSIPAAAAAQFANPLVAQFGVQPDSGWGIGQYADVTQIQTLNVASPGVPINTDFTTISSIDTNVWYGGNCLHPDSLVHVNSDAAWWVSWEYPDTGFGLGTKADLGNTAVPWKTPSHYTGYEPNAVLQERMGNNVWALIPRDALPTLDGLTNGAPSTSAYFRLEKPAPAE